MDSFHLNLTLVVTRREDGTLLARAKELPVMVAARDLAALTRKFAAVAESIIELAAFGPYRRND